MHTTCPHCRSRFADPKEALAHCLDHYLAATGTVAGRSGCDAVADDSALGEPRA